MKYIQFLHWIIFPISLLLSLSCYANDKSDNIALTIFVDSNYPPYMYKLNGIEADGLYPRLLEEIARQAGKKVELNAYPWARALSEGALGKGAVGGAYKNHERLKIYDYSKPIYQEKLVVFVNKNSKFDFKGISDLKGKIVGVNRAWSYGQNFDSARDSNLFSVNVRNKPSENFKMLALGRIDCLILDQLSGESYIRLMGLEDQVMVLPTPFSINNAYLMIHKKRQMKDFLSDFNTGLDELRKSGKYQAIV